MFGHLFKRRFLSTNYLAPNCILSQAAYKSQVKSIHTPPSVAEACAVRQEVQSAAERHLSAGSIG